MNENELFNYKEVHTNDHLVRVDKNGKMAYENTFKCLARYYEVNKPISIVNEINSKDKWIDDYFKKQDENKVPSDEELMDMLADELEIKQGF